MQIWLPSEHIWDRMGRNRSVELFFSPQTGWIVSFKQMRKTKQKHLTQTALFSPKEEIANLPLQAQLRLYSTALVPGELEEEPVSPRGTISLAGGGQGERGLREGGRDIS